MKKILFIIVAYLMIFSFLNADYNLLLLKKETGIPVKKLKEYLDLPQNYPVQSTIKSISKEDIKNFKKRFEQEKMKFILSITLSGMGVVFISLIIVAFLIAQLRHAKTIQKKIGPAKPCRNLNNDALVAAMFTIFLHELEVEEQNKLMLTWKRTPISMWKAVAKAETPNLNYYREKKR